MTPDERTLLTNFLNELVATRGVAKDNEADALIRQALAANPDAGYVLVQHAIVADQSLHAAQGRIAELERQVAPPAPSPSFLPTDRGPWGGSQPAYAPPAPGARPGILSGGGGLGSFLRSAGTTAAGVAGGEMLFSGLSDLFGGHHGGGFGGGGQGFLGAPEENVVINNYGDDDDNNDSSDW
ncbi:DUF2076 domain-containing protein [Sphingomonas sp. 2SG]|uniref:DUF2076 domain-containing protein n=1 Tax=Sphingomonas sp. 2SG TaxID=2502201 RepID=UPI0014853851|nr:DUF2076 domain-containing protein [Sphingomonas sp. 2SG]